MNTKKESENDNEKEENGKNTRWKKRKNRRNQTIWLKSLWPQGGRKTQKPSQSNKLEAYQSWTVKQAPASHESNNIRVDSWLLECCSLLRWEPLPSFTWRVIADNKTMSWEQAVKSLQLCRHCDEAGVRGRSPSCCIRLSCTFFFPQVQFKIRTGAWLTSPHCRTSFLNLLTPLAFFFPRDPSVIKFLWAAYCRWW